MASLAKIGAQIGVEGYSTFAKTISNIKRDMKEFKAEVKAVTSSFDDEIRTIKQNNEWKEKQNKLIDATKNKLQEEKAVIEAITSARSKLGEQYIQKQQEILNSAVTTKEQTEQLAQAEKEYADAMELSYREEQKYNTQSATTQANLNQLNKELKDAPSNLKMFADAWKNATSQEGEIIRDIGKGFTKYVTTPIVAGTVASVKAAADWETAFTGVKKTNDEIVDSNGNVIYSYEQLEKELQGVGLETASSYTEIAKVAETLGQLGFSTDVIGEATKYIIQLADSTSLAAEEGASYVATILNLMNRGLPVTAEQVNNLGSALVYLGNNYNTTETDIAHMAARLAPAAAQLELSAADVLALSTALSTAQITAEGGGTAMTQVLTNITKNVANFRNNAESTLPRIAEIAGMSADDFADAWEKKPITAIDAFITGLSKLDENGEYTAIVFDELGMSGIRQSLSLNALAITHEQLSRAIKDSNREYKNGNALSDEANKKYSTADSQIQQLKNSLALLGNALGKDMLPMLKDVVDGLTNFFTKLSEMDEGTKKIIFTIGGLLAVVGPVLTVAGNVLIFSAKIKESLGVLGLTIGGTGEKVTGLKSLFEGLGTTLTDKVIPAISSNIGLVGALATIPAAYKIATDAATEMNTKMFESAAACEYVASRYHWSEEKVNEFGYTWTENGHLIELANSNLTASSDTMVDDVTIDIEEMKEMMRARSKEAAEGVTNAISNEKGNLQATTYQFVNTGVEEIRSASNETYRYGQELGGNFASGIESRQSWVSRAASGLASIVRSFLHFSEPDVGPLADFHTWMPDFMQGLANDINKYSYLVEDAIHNVAQSMTITPNSNSVNYGGVVINLNVPEGTNGQQLVNEIETELANRSIRRRAVFG